MSLGIGLGEGVGLSVSTPGTSERLDYGFLLLNEEAEMAFSVARRLNESYTGPLLRVRRTNGNAEQDIPFALVDGKYVLDETNLLSFVGTSSGNHGYVVRILNQDGTGTRNAIQTSMSAQPPIVIDGVVVKGPESNKPSYLCDGTNHFFEIEDGGADLDASNLSLTVFESSGTESNESRVGFSIKTTSTNSFGWYLVPGYSIVFSSYGTNATHFIRPTNTDGFIAITYGDGQIPALVKSRLNGAEGSSATITVNESLKFTHLGIFSNNFMHKGYKSEDVFYASNRKQSLEFIEVNTNNFYQMF